MRAAAVLAVLPESGSELEQVLALLRASSEDEPEALTVGTGDRRLLALHRALTGRDIELTVACGECETVNELALGAVPDEAPRVAVCGVGGGVRAPAYRDLLGLPPDADEAVTELLRRCTVGSPSRRPEPGDLDRVDDSLVGPVTAACAECGAPLELALDVEPLLLAGLHEQLRRIDHEIHVLAQAYHWDLETIEGLSDDRRARLARLVMEER